MTLELTNLQLNDDSSRLDRLETLRNEFFDVSLRKDNETMFERAERSLDYLEKLNKKEQEFVNYQFSSLVGYLYEVRNLNKFKRQNE